MKNLVHVIYLTFFIQGIFGQDISVDEQDKRIDKNVLENRYSEFLFYAGDDLEKLESKVAEISESTNNRHKLGPEIADLLYLFDEEFTDITEPAPGSFSGRLIIQKPVIYNSIYKLEKYYKTGIRKGLISREEGVQSLAIYIKYSLIVLNRNSTSLETALESAESEEEILNIYGKIRME